MIRRNYSMWWGPPKKFSTQVAERKISWLELFYDLVYVIVISKITHYLTEHPNMISLADYGYMMAMTFWGWGNGSMYYDIHGSPGIRTRFMTLWQMMAVGALAVALGSPLESLIYRTTIALLFLQLFIIYLWWSVGLYDKEHRKIDAPYTICYLLAAALLFATFFVPLPYKRIVFWVALVLNYLPFGLMVRLMRLRHEEFNLSVSMTERLGLLTIIVFGEAILGVVNSVSHAAVQSGIVWLCFGIGILIVFALWWIFFSVGADREVHKGTWSGNMLLLIYIPTLSSLGMVGASFPTLVERISIPASAYTSPLQVIFGVSIALFLFCVCAMGRLLVYPAGYERLKGSMQALLLITGVVNLLLILLFPVMPVLVYLLCVFASLLVVVVVLTRSWYKVELSVGEHAHE